MRNKWLHVNKEEEMTPDRIEREILIDAPVETVWATLTEPEHVGGWFSDVAEIDLRQGGLGTLTWKKFGDVRLRVEKVEPPHTFSFRWARPLGAEVGAGNSTLVEFSLTPEGGGTRLRMIESGFRELDRSEEEKAQYLEENSSGWDHELGELIEYVAKQIGVSARP
jgi:uncharacterized protein YndB with AHSA1/START domain